MSIDQLSDSESILEILDKTGIIESSSVPAIFDLKSMADFSSVKKREYGVQIAEVGTEDKHRKALYVKGETGSIREPPKPADVLRGVFFHTHFNTTHRHLLWPKSWINPIQLSWEMLPSDAGIEHAFESWAGDITANFSTRTLGGYLNIASPFGLVMRVGVMEGESNKRLDDSQWEIMIGTQRGKIFTAKERIFDHTSVPDPMMVWSHKWPHAKTSFYLLLSWDEVSKLNQTFGDLENLCFGDGVEKLVKELGLDIPYGQNLSEITKII